MTRKVWYISQGSESEDRFKLLLSGTGLRSESMISALNDHLVKGLSVTDSCSVNGISNINNFQRDLGKLNDFCSLVEKIKELDWVKFKAENK